MNKMRNCLVVHLTIILTLATQNGIAATEKILECPSSVPESSIRLENVPAGWTAFIARPLYLKAAAPIDGPPQRKGTLAEYEERKGKGETTYVYRLEGEYPEGKWLQCSYGEYGQIALSKRLDDVVSLCKFTYKPGPKAGQNIIQIQCS